MFDASRVVFDFTFFCKVLGALQLLAFLFIQCNFNSRLF